MKLRWDIDDFNVVAAKIGGFGKSTLSINEKVLPNKLSLRKKNEFSFQLSDGRQATILIKPQFATRPIIDLQVDGQLMVETGKNPILCSHCETIVKPNDRFCGSCGQVMPTADDYVNKRYVKEATGAIKILAILFAVVGLFMFYVTKSQSANLLLSLNSMQPEDTYPVAIKGVKYTVAVLRNQLTWAPWSVLIVNMILATVMTVLAFWGRRAPLAAVLVATATYSVLIVTNAIIDPKTIGQGIYLKLVIIVLLVRGIKAALALRTANA